MKTDGGFLYSDRINFSVKPEEFCTYDGKNGQCLYKKTWWGVCMICKWRKDLDIPKMLLELSKE